MTSFTSLPSISLRSSSILSSSASTPTAGTVVTHHLCACHTARQAADQGQPLRSSAAAAVLVFIAVFIAPSNMLLQHVHQSHNRCCAQHSDTS